MTSRYGATTASLIAISLSLSLATACSSSSKVGPAPDGGMGGQGAGSGTGGAGAGAGSGTGGAGTTTGAGGAPDAGSGAGGKGSGGATCQLGPIGDLGGQLLFPPDHPLNAAIDQLPVHPMSAQWIAGCSPDDTLRLDFSMPYNVVPPGTQMVSGSFYYSGDVGPWAIPANAVVEGPTDSHCLALDCEKRLAYEIFNFSWADSTNKAFKAGSGTIWHLDTNPPPGPPSSGADAAGLPILPLLIRYDELAETQSIRHAIRFTCASTQGSYLSPARAAAGNATGSQYPPMGMRVRMKADVDISSYPAELQVLLVALKKYGLILADNGGAGTPWFMTGVADPRLDTDLMNTLYVVHNLHANAAMEVVDTGAKLTPE